MKKLAFKTMINAAPEKIWEVLLGKDTYPIWTAVFAEGSDVKTDWKKGSKAIFLDGKGNGMVSEIAENIPGKFLSIRHLGDVINGKEDLESEKVKEWAGAYENYTLTEVDGQTEWSISLDIVEEYEDYMMDTWPQALEKVKALAENKG
ncbi:SRPBCC domain-containing protein [Pedobacter gandavensis]|uniref:SRPBCC domain-containing protein n=1 Tax=Pedobacter TaxID=84567 RepID=UPI001C99C729|nr:MULTISPECIES: SRPBCC domain-containing protein [Pedobacter]WGQ11830.1 SRPBCC domain-containing protein [Pedobacter gandavensis]